MHKLIKGTLVVIAAVSLGGCAALFSHRPSQRVERSSSLVGFLYPGGAPPLQDAVPVLHLPLTVGVAFIPPASGQQGMLDATHKARILEAIRTRFQSRAFVREIVTIPDYYLAGQRGFEGLASLQRLYSLDLVALVSYDQIARQDNNGMSLTYLTIVGSWLFPGTSQDVNTLVDLAVVHPGTRSLVIRAAGMDTRNGISTEVGAARSMRERAVTSFQASADRMIDNFDAELVQFEQRVRQGTARVQIANPGAGGGGSLDGLLLVLLAVLLAAGLAGRVRRSGGGLQ